MANELTTRQSAAPVATLADIKEMAASVAESGLFGMKDQRQAMALMLVCQSEGCHPMAAVGRYHVFQGKASWKSEALLANFQTRGGTVKWVTRTETECEAVFTSAGCPDGLTVRWTIDEARRAGLVGKDNWKSYPRQMLSARVVAEGVRATDPGAMGGVPTREEVEDRDPAAETAPKASPFERTVINVTPTAEEESPTAASEEPDWDKAGEAVLDERVEAIRTEAGLTTDAMDTFAQSHKFPSWTNIRIAWKRSACKNPTGFVDSVRAAVAAAAKDAEGAA